MFLKNLRNMSSYIRTGSNSFQNKQKVKYNLQNYLLIFELFPNTFYKTKPPIGAKYTPTDTNIL